MAWWRTGSGALKRAAFDAELSQRIGGKVLHTGGRGLLQVRLFGRCHGAEGRYVVQVHEGH